MKGKTEPVRAYALKSEIPGRTRLEVSKERGLTPLAGRERQLRLLLEAYHWAARDSPGARQLLEQALTIFEELGTLEEPPHVRAALAALGPVDDS